MNPAKAARLNREKHPELYCSKCLWRTGGGDCPRHAARQMMQEMIDSAAAGASKESLESQLQASIDRVKEMKESA